ncbi:MFS transporter [Cupriavidus sp. 2KB_3]|uniref:MFS transporter n=1 Tax=Cupriavidus TaxID=106589 RepID=UPI0011EF56FC|nr:MFS transporter [Cupriavidus campinensis]
MIDKEQDGTSLSGRSVLVLAAACGFAVANLYYSQPLLPAMAATFDAGAEAQGAIAMLTQFGYASGLLLFGPLGDRLDRRRLVAVLLLANMAALLLCASAQNLPWLLAASVLLGLTAMSAQVIIPAVSGQVAPAQRGQTVGRLLSGLFAGTLLARTVSGYVGAHAGWRSMFLLAAILNLVVIAVAWLHLPRAGSDGDLPYGRLLRSLVELFTREPILREACLTGFLLFAAFNVLWGALAMMLARPPYGWGSEVSGLFGLVGLVGMFASPTVGRIADRFGGRRVVGGAAILVMLAFGLVAGSMWSIAWLIAGMVVLDLGSRANLVANQTRLYALLPAARGRLNTIFMSCYFLGGAAGSTVGTFAGGRYGWQGVAIAGLLCAALALIATVWVRAAAHRAVSGE